MTSVVLLHPFEVASAYRFRPIGTDDTIAVVKLFADDEIAKWTLPLGVKPEESATEWAQTVQTGYSIGVWRESTLVGCASFREGQVCFAVTPAHQRRGIAAETLRLLMLGLEDNHIFSVVALCRRGNAAATAILLKRGFVFKGLSYHRNKFHEEALAHFDWSAVPSSQ